MLRPYGNQGMGKGRFLYNNLIASASMLTASSIFPGTVGSALKEGTGSGTMTPSGAYTGTDDRLYTIEIDLAGDVGVATFKWRKNTDAGFPHAGVPTDTAGIALEDGVTVRFAAGTGTDFALADRWTFKAVRFFAPGKLIDLDPDVPWRSNLLSARPALADVNVEVFLPAARNDILRSEEIDNAAWTKSNLTITPDDATAPDGAATSDALVESADAGPTQHEFFQSYTGTGGTAEQAVSIFAKPNVRTQVQLDIWFSAGVAEARATFDLTGAGSVVNTFGSLGRVVDSATIEAVPGASGWYRCKLIVHGVVTDNTSYIIRVRPAVGGSQDYQGNGSKACWVWGAQVENDQPTVRPYLPTAGAIASRAASFTDVTAAALDANSVLTGAFWTGHAGGPAAAERQYVYIGSTAPFDRVTADLSTLAAGAGALVAEYYNGSSWTALSGVTDGTASGGNTLAQDGDVTWTIPTNWAKQGDASLDADKYYIRLSPTNAFVTTDPNADRLSPSFLPETVTVDLASAQQIRGIVLHGHNVSSGATAIQLLANSSNEWGSPAYTLSLTWNQDTIAAFLDQTYRYWQVRVADQGNTEGYIEIGEMFLGTYFEPSKNYVLDFDEAQEADEEEERTAAGVPRPVLRNRARTFDLPYRLLPAADRTSFTTLFEAIKSRSAVKSKPFFFTPDSAAPEATFFVHWAGALRFVRRSSGFADLRVSLEERPLSPF